MILLYNSRTRIIHMANTVKLQSCLTRTCSLLLGICLWSLNTGVASKPVPLTSPSGYQHTDVKLRQQKIVSHLKSNDGQFIAYLYSPNNVTMPAVDQLQTSRTLVITDKTGETTVYPQLRSPRSAQAHYVYMLRGWTHNNILILQSELVDPGVGAASAAVYFKRIEPFTKHVTAYKIPGNSYCFSHDLSKIVFLTYCTYCDPDSKQGIIAVIDFNLNKKIVLVDPEIEQRVKSGNYITGLYFSKDNKKIYYNTRNGKKLGQYRLILPENLKQQN